MSNNEQKLSDMPYCSLIHLPNSEGLKVPGVDATEWLRCDGCLYARPVSYEILRDGVSHPVILVKCAHPTTHGLNRQQSCPFEYIPLISNSQHVR